jgi:hypothetical protein
MNNSTQPSILKFDDFRNNNKLMDGHELIIVVKSQDQTVRRRRLLAGRKDGKFGRTEERPTAVGLLVKVVLTKSKVKIIWKKEFPEPRHVIRLKNGNLAFTDVNKVNILDDEGTLIERVSDPLFAFLHSLEQHALDQDRLLICSSGFDAIIETNIKSHERVSLWSAWENGFNPDENGNWLSLTKEYYQTLQNQNKPTKFIDPNIYGEQGINTKFRSAHPNVAVYNPYKNYETIIVSIGHGGKLIETSINSSSPNTQINAGLSDMPHGLTAYQGGWFVTDTTKGEVLFLTKNFELVEKIELFDFPGKTSDLGDIEWVQNTKAISGKKYLSVDANRGLIALDKERMEYNIFQPDREWCIQDLISATEII